ncbi:MAG: D-alanyl-lipoteichoic acid biosynthesis protein DltB [Terrimicrobiaceae bacterium]|nr:D-alanyl-lipoteichoic acid biosynthesis protein DltB [Terrimicrobiaceae bacterium]
MIPYTDLGYFGALLAFAAPILLLRRLGKDVRYWIVGASAIVIALQFSTSRPALISLGIFAMLQAGVALVFAKLCRIVPSKSGERRWLFYLALALTLLPLIACRLIPYFTKGISFGFLGISYVTFRSLDVIFGLDDGLILSLDAVQLLAFLFFFPPLSSGPIDRYRRFEKDWLSLPDRPRLVSDLDAAVHHIFRGLFYKFIIAYLVKKYWLDPVGAQAGAAAMVSYMYAYSAFLFFDFAGYSAFAVGASYLFGIHTPENFNRPFLAADIRDFWTRWHISLSSWFRDHVYMRFVLTAARNKWFKNNRNASHVGYGLTFGLMGVWHGLAPNFLIYGLYHAVLLIGHDIFKQWNQKRQILGSGHFSKGFGIFTTFNAVCFGFLIFSGHLTFGLNTVHPKVKAGLHATNRPRQIPAIKRPRATISVHDGVGTLA